MESGNDFITDDAGGSHVRNDTFHAVIAVQAQSDSLIICNGYKDESYIELALLLKNRSLCEGFIFSDAGRPVGTIWVMYQGANDIEYRIRRIEAYIFDVYINENYRGNGYAGEMICLLMKYLHERGINSSYLAVAKTNKSAIRAYKKVGFKSIVDKKFARVLRVNIPYHEL